MKIHLLNRSHFLHLWTINNYDIDGMDEEFIMTVHSDDHISYLEINENSPQKTQEEFIFTIATVIYFMF